MKMMSQTTSGKSKFLTMFEKVHVFLQYKFSGFNSFLIVLVFLAVPLALLKMSGFPANRNGGLGLLPLSMPIL